jgi:hypothetical protein
MRSTTPSPSVPCFTESPVESDGTFATVCTWLFAGVP